MCGIVGIIKKDNGGVNIDELKSAADMLAKRGPDDAGIWIEENIGVGHRRLAVLDISPAAHQPMPSACGRYIIVYNGEIYNYRELRRELDNNGKAWLSNSDTEVILAAYAKWGTSCVKHFHGMFSFAIWDRYERLLFAARDRMGVKPFYYAHSDSLFSFASRPRALFALCPDLPSEIDEQALRFYLELGYIPAPYFIYKDIRKLPPAHYLLLRNNEVRIERYWDFRHVQPESSFRSEDELLEELDALISRCVRSRMVSDVPLGAFLSGGIDSSLIVAIMSKFASKPVKTFTIEFDEKKYDESAHAKAVAEYLGTEHYCERLSVKYLLKLMPVFLEEYDEPFFDSSAFPTMAVSRLARQHVTVSLSGDGGDELFGGYHYYQIAKRLAPLFKLNSGFRRGLAAAVSLIPKHQFKLLAGALRQPDSASAFAFSRSIAKDFQEVILPEVARKTMSSMELFVSLLQTFPSTLHPCEQGMRIDALSILPEEYLQKVDIASMAFSLESREPFLDQDVVEWAMRLPIAYKLRGGQNKYLLRRLAYKYIPKAILDRPKQGFGVPIDVWLREDLRNWAEARLNDDEIFRNIPLNKSRVLELWELHKSGKRNAHSLLWAILALLEFIKKSKRI